MENKLRSAQPSPPKLYPQRGAGKLLVALFCLVLPAVFCAVDLPPYPEEYIHENLELILDELPDLLYLQSFAESRHFALKQELGFRPAFELWQELAYHKPGLSAHLNSLYKAKELHPKIQISALDTYSLGHYRFGWGNGLTLPKMTSAAPLPPPSPSNTYSPLGYSIRFQHKSWQIMNLASYQKRVVRLSDGKISQLPQTKSKSLQDSGERILAGALGCEYKALYLGTILYTQKYEHEFNDPALAAQLNSYGLFGRYRGKKQSLAFELARQKALSARLNWDYRYAPFAHSVSYSYLKRYQKPAYTPHPGSLGRQANQEEFFTKLSWQAFKALRLESRAAFYKQHTDLAKKPWLNETKLSLVYGDAAQRATLSLSGLDQDILSAFDESFVSGRPRHYRLSFSAVNRLGAYRHKASFRHQYQELRPDIRQNNWWKQALDYDFGHLRCGLGYNFYSGGKYPMYVPDDGNAGYQMLQKSRLELEGTCELRVKKLSLKLKAQKELSGEAKFKSSLALSYKN